jgi:hypothetical protein
MSAKILVNRAKAHFRREAKAPFVPEFLAVHVRSREDFERESAEEFVRQTAGRRPAFAAQD